GLWRSLDGGESWMGLNDGFANLPVQRLVVANGETALRIVVGDAEFAWRAGERSAWQPVEASDLAREAEIRTKASAALQLNIVTAAAAGEFLYAGSADGILVFSRDGGTNWAASGPVAGTGRIE